MIGPAAAKGANIIHTRIRHILRLRMGLFFLREAKQKVRRFYRRPGVLGLNLYHLQQVSTIPVRHWIELLDASAPRA